ncbi:hypothetical protein J6T66_04355 [bacterium]|nr:hypothetical protein [bacterium]
MEFRNIEDRGEVKKNEGKSGFIVEKRLKRFKENKKNTEEQHKKDSEEADGLLSNMMNNMDNEKFKNLEKKESLTDEEVQWMVDFANEKFGGELDCKITNITDKQAEYLSKVNSLFLDSLTSITDKQAGILSKVNELSLYSLKKITDNQAREL